MAHQFPSNLFILIIFRFFHVFLKNGIKIFSFVFKLQVILILPVFLIAYFCGKKYSIFLWLRIPVTYLEAGLPALLCGVGFLLLLMLGMLAIVHDDEDEAPVDEKEGETETV